MVALHAASKVDKSFFFTTIPVQPDSAFRNRHVLMWGFGNAGIFYSRQKRVDHLHQDR